MNSGPSYSRNVVRRWRSALSARSAEFERLKSRRRGLGKGPRDRAADGAIKSRARRRSKGRDQRHDGPSDYDDRDGVVGYGYVVGVIRGNDDQVAAMGDYAKRGSSTSKDPSPISAISSIHTSELKHLTGGCYEELCDLWADLLEEAR